MKPFVEQLNTAGYAIIPGFLSAAETADISAEVDRIYADGLKHHATYRDRNLLFEILDDPKARRRVVLQAHWTAWISPLMESMRRSPKYFEVLQPFLGSDIKQMSHQVHWKPPGAKYTSYRFHQDARFRTGNLTEHDYLRSTVTTGLAIDRQTVENGALRVFPGKVNRLGYLGSLRRRAPSWSVKLRTKSCVAPASIRHRPLPARWSRVTCCCGICSQCTARPLTSAATTAAS